MNGFTQEILGNLTWEDQVEQSLFVLSCHVFSDHTTPEVKDGLSSDSHKLVVLVQAMDSVPDSLPVFPESAHEMLLHCLNGAPTCLSIATIAKLN